MKKCDLIEELVIYSLGLSMLFSSHTTGHGTELTPLDRNLRPGSGTGGNLASMPLIFSANSCRYRFIVFIPVLSCLPNEIHKLSDWPFTSVCGQVELRPEVDWQVLTPNEC
jgi:hypothetical protein